MRTLPHTSPSAVPYWSDLKNLSNEVKLELIALLSSSMIEKQDEDWTASFAGKWQDSRTTEEIINGIHSSRTKNTRLEEIEL